MDCRWAWAATSGYPCQNWRAAGMTMVELVWKVNR